MSRRRSTHEQAAAGELGALRWTLLQRSGDTKANHLLIAMGWRANDTFKCHMSVRSMAEILECHERTIQHKIKLLLLLGFINDISDEYPKRRTRTYRLNAPVVCI